MNHDEFWLSVSVGISGRQEVSFREGNRITDVLWLPGDETLNTDGYNRVWALRFNGLSHTAWAGGDMFYAHPDCLAAQMGAPYA